MKKFPILKKELLNRNAKRLYQTIYMFALYANIFIEQLLNTKRKRSILSCIIDV